MSAGTVCLYKPSIHRLMYIITFEGTLVLRVRSICKPLTWLSSGKATTTAAAATATTTTTTTTIANTILDDL